MSPLPGYRRLTAAGAAVAFILLLLLPFSGRGAGASGRELTPETNLEKPMNTKFSTLSAVPGETFTITLPSNITTGFGWKMPSPPEGEVLEFLDSEYIPPDRPRIGGGGVEEWRFRALSPGEARIELEYVRAWEKGIPPTRRASYLVVVGTDSAQETGDRSQESGARDSQ